MDEREAYIALNAVMGLGNRAILKLVSRLGSAKAVWSLDRHQWEKQGIVSKAVFEKIVEFPKDTFLESEYNLISKHGVSVYTINDGEYPPLLREITDAPVVLYIKGKIPQAMPMIGIVGSRRASVYGISVARSFAARLSEYGVVVVSGMARGIDTAAHQGAVAIGMPTVAVLGSGLADIYPRENRELFKKISECGAVISEFPMTMPPLAYNFPRRNRIVSGLSAGVIVVEADEKSGALITADFALEQGREVYAVPGKVDNPTSRGVHNLIKQGAKLAASVEDVLEDLQGSLSAVGAPATKQAHVAAAAKKILSDSQCRVFERISAKPIHVDELLAHCDGDTRISGVLFELEMQKLIRQLPGKYYVRV